MLNCLVCMFCVACVCLAVSLVIVACSIIVATYYFVGKVIVVVLVCFDLGFVLLVWAAELRLFLLTYCSLRLWMLLFGFGCYVWVVLLGGCYHGLLLFVWLTLFGCCWVLVGVLVDLLVVDLVMAWVEFCLVLFSLIWFYACCLCG